MSNYFNKKFVMAMAVLAVAGIGVFAPLAPFRNLFLTGLEGCRKYLSRYFRFLVLALCLLTGFGIAGQAQAVREYKASVKASGGDYTSLSAAEDGLDYTGTADLTSSDYKIAAYTVTTDDPTGINDAEVVSWDGGASTGNN